MLDKKSRRVVIINNIQSDTIDQAIFILKNQKSTRFVPQNNIVNEAQSIINQYMHQVERLKPLNRHRTKKEGRWHIFTPSALVTVAITAAFMLVVFFFVTYTR